ncbi:zinc dependent phospholipase C family protein [Brevundimonas sp.]|uniref:zinc dependent phospholipase C family protein n=2 Tax=Brevundimonas TaxID=41275 RepID=UPI0035B3554E
MRAILAVGVTIAALSAATPGHAFGLRTHLYIADQVWQDVNQDCLVGVGGRSAPIEPALCQAIRNNRGAFLAGAIGPDAFPDLLVGQNYVHPGTPDGRQTADWLQHVLETARTPEEVAFAYGQLIHAAGDTFAHSYVNNYAGGVFELTARWHKDVEKRHFQLEKYIDQHLSYQAPVDELRVPSGLLVRAMVETSYVPGDFNLTEADLRAFGRGPGPAAQQAAALLAVKVGRAAPATHMTAMWAMLEVSSREADAAVCADIVATHRLADAYGQYVQAEAAARGVTLTWSSRSAAPNVCTPEAQAAAEAELDRADALRSHIPWHDQAVNERDTWLATLPSARHQRLVATRAAYLEAMRAREETKAIAAFAPQWRDDVRLAVEAYMQASLASARIMVRNSEPYPTPEHRRRSTSQPYKAWWDCYGPVFSGDPIEAADARCARLASLEVDDSLSDVALRTGIGRAPRGLLFTYLRLQDWAEDLRNDILLGLAEQVNPAAVELGEGMLEPIRVTRSDMNATFRAGRNGQITFQCVSDFIDVDLGLLTQKGGNDEILPDEPCRDRPAGGDGAGEFFDPARVVPVQHAVTLGKLALVGRQEVSDLAFDWSGERPALGSPSQSGRYSVVLDMARSLDGSQQWTTISLPPPLARGLATGTPTHGAGYPAERARDVVATVPLDPVIDQARPGFPFYRTPNLRRTAFAALFPGPYEGQILRRVEYGVNLYPFRPCDGDPFRPGLSGPERTELCPEVRSPGQRAVDDAGAALRRAWTEQLDRCLGREDGRLTRLQAGCLR